MDNDDEPPLEDFDAGMGADDEGVKEDFAGDDNDFNDVMNF